ncbi:1-phosphatidylinositol-3-phosphate 5-kinase [Orbilia oligospora]|uniref:1-phosphatidylinositol-3-phosphate 5-kinase n=1 Tax=Orbilia oligospora TaxID=2813651 RepID=A0A7C8J0V5_ORBOL|nr:1-phosphatidylinositol-3-phosphate 5-kinase [Orbilia oligospora]KAF3084417.1 1-phosphatidylinositol-3-phosphate 5-kinase [Orbilia oligospora]KAF3084418.1 1-phosphatidylinositol-3-phosphate 5-kinase, variant 2 [Orbilia oligospora]
MDRTSQRRPSLDSISSVLTPSQPIDPAVLDDIHAVAANSPTLTSFSLTPSRKKITVPEQTGLNRIYSLVKGVVGSSKDGPDSPSRKSRHEHAGKNDDAASIRSGYSHIEATSDLPQLVSPTFATNPSKPAEFSPMSPFQELISPIKGPTRKTAMVERAATRTPQPEERGRPVREKLYSDLSRANSTRSLNSTGQRTPASANFPRIGTPYQTQAPFENADSLAEFGDEQDYGSFATSLNEGSAVLVDAQNRQGHSRRESLMSVASGQYDPLGNKRVDIDLDDVEEQNDPDNDKASEISTDDDDDVIEMGGYLGKVSGLGKALNDKNLELAAPKAEPVTSNTTASAKEGRRTSTSTSAIQSPIVASFSPSASRHQYRASMDKTMEIPTEDLLDGDVIAEPLPHHPSLKSPLLAAEEVPQEDIYLVKDTDSQVKPSASSLLAAAILDTDETVRIRKPRLKTTTQHGLLQRGSSSSSVATGTTTTGRGDQGTVEMSRAVGNDTFPTTLQGSSNLFQNEAKVGATLRQLRQGKGLSRDFWMKDENCKECFICQRPFTTFRRKHHCRTCGQIFCSKCTTTVEGDKFGHSGGMRVCINPCLQILENYQDDDSSGTEANYSFKPSRRVPSGNAPKTPKGGRPKSGVFDPQTNTPRKRPNRIGTKQVAALDYDSGALTPSRPSSARSMRRPVSSYNLFQQVQAPGTPTGRSQHSKSVARWSIFGQVPSPESNASEDHRAPFQGPSSEILKNSIAKDSIIDPELAPYMSDEDADGEDEPMGIFATIAPKFQSPQEDDMMKQITANTNALSTLPTDNNGTPGEVKTIRPPPRHKKTVSISAILPPSSSRSHGIPTPLQAQFQGHRRRKSGYSMGPQTPVVSQNYLALLQKSSHKSLLTPGSRNSFGALLGNIPVDYGFLKQLKPKAELNAPSTQHVKRLLHQMLAAAKIDNVKAWENALLPAIFKCTDEVKSDVRNGESIDLRHFCKIKRIPGGKPSDTHYVSGVVFAKNLALKSMRRTISHPRIVVVAFPVEYHRHQAHFMSLEPVIAQEKDYLRAMVNRILSLKPSIVLVERDVSGLALEYLREQNIAVAMRVKPTVIEAVARCAQADIIMSAEETTFRSHRVGKCLSFDVKTYAHKDIATATNRRTYMYFSGCRADLGCTIVLRGANASVLAKIKRITEFMVYAVYNMKLETTLLEEEGAIIPDSVVEGSLERSGTLKPDKLVESLRLNADTAACADVTAEARANGNVIAAQISEEPIAIADEKASLRESEEPKQEEPQSNDSPVENEKPKAMTQSGTLIPESTEDYPEDLPAPNYYSEYVKEHENKILSVSPFIKFAQPHLLMRARDFERRLEFLKRQIKQLTGPELNVDANGEVNEPFELITPEMLHGQVAGKSRKMNELVRAVHEAEYDKVLFIYETQKKQWENYLAQNEDLFDPLEHQRIVMLYSMISTDTSIPCRGPENILFEYYNDQDDDEEEYSRDRDYFREADCTLGQYVHDLIHTRDYLCDTGCGKPMMEHHRSYVHGEARISVQVEAYPTPVKADTSDDILMWSICKICVDKTPTTPVRMSDSTWRYSLGKFFETGFWSVGLKTQKDGCIHDLHRDHIRYFGMNDHAVKIDWAPIALMEVTVPRPKVTWKPELDLKMKNEIYLNMNSKINKYWDSVTQRLDSINVEAAVATENIEACKAEIEALLIRAEEERSWLVAKLQEKYTNSRYYEVIPLNRAMRALQERVSDWDNVFSDFYEKFFPSEKDIARMATAQLRKLFLDRSSTSSTVHTDTESTTTADKESIQSVIMDDGPGSSPTSVRRPSQMSPETAQEVLTSVVDDNTKGPSESLVDSRQNSVSEHSGNQADSTELKAESEAGRPAESGRDDSSLHGTSPELPSSPEMTRANSLSASVQTIPSVTDESSHPVSPANSSPVLERSMSKSVENTDSPATSSMIGSLENSQRLEESREHVEDKDTKQDKGHSDDHSASDHAPTAASAIPVPAKPLNQRRKGPNPLPPPGRQSTIYGSGRTGTSGSTISTASTTRALGLTQSMRPTDLLRKKSEKTGKKLQKPPPEPKPDRQKAEKIKISDRMRHVTTTLAGKGHAKQHPQMQIPRSHPGTTFGSGPRVSNLAKRFEELSREFQRERENNERRTLANRRSRAFPVVSMKPMVEVFKDIEQAAQEVSDDEIEDAPVPEPQSVPVPEANKFADAMGATEHTLPSPEIQAKQQEEEEKTEEAKEEPPEEKTSEETPGEPSGEPRPKTAEHEVEASDTEMSLVSDSESSKILSAVAEEALKVPEVSDEIKAEVEAGLQRSERSSLMKLLTNFWSERSSSGWSALDYPLMPSDHVFSDSDVIVREDEPSSLIAFTLGMPSYNSMLAQLRADAMNSLESSVGTIMHEGTTHHHHEHPNELDHAVQRSLLRETGTHLRYHFPRGNARMYCKVFFAEQFDALRRNCGVADRFIESLSRCIKWDSKGGKTKSVFLKTLDDRIILKQLSPIETAAFLKFAPSYFHIMSEALFHELPTAIAKMLGFFTIYIKNPNTGTEFRWDLLVMENLFYDRKMSRTFDLKGSMRNRYVQETGEQNEVLLDENMVDYVWKNPLFVREHSKKLLRASLWNDTLFLERNQVMDYSLMVGIDDQRKELVIGLIDCVRTYTFDKKIENYIKSTGIAGGRNKPTITSPKEYKRRFREAMERYVLEAPNCWRQPRVTWLNPVGIPFAAKKQLEEAQKREQEMAAGAA